MVYSIMDSRSIVCLKDDPKLAFDLLLQGQICIPVHLYGENVEKSFSQNVLKTNG